jgi:hypothetical protein
LRWRIASRALGESLEIVDQQARHIERARNQSFEQLDADLPG